MYRNPDDIDLMQAERNVLEFPDSLPVFETYRRIARDLNQPLPAEETATRYAETLGLWPYSDNTQPSYVPTPPGPMKLPLTIPRPIHITTHWDEVNYENYIQETGANSQYLWIEVEFYWPDLPAMDRIESTYWNNIKLQLNLETDQFNLSPHHSREIPEKFSGLPMQLTWKEISNVNNANEHITKWFKAALQSLGWEYVEDEKEFFTDFVH